jgi:hypothetical protein
MKRYSFDCYEELIEDETGDWVKYEPWMDKIKPIYEGHAMKIVIENHYSWATRQEFLLPRMQKYKIIAIPID